MLYGHASTRSEFDGQNAQTKMQQKVVRSVIAVRKNRGSTTANIVCSKAGINRSKESTL